MGFFDFIGDALGAIASPFTAVIDAGTKLLGLPPVVGDALKVAVGAVTGDVFTLMQGSTQLLKDLAGNPAETEYAPPTDEPYGGTDGWAPPSSPRTALIADGGDGGNSNGEVTASSAEAPDDPPTDATSVGDGDAEERRALETLARNFDAMNRDHGLFGAFGDKVITEKELRETAEDPDAPVDLKRAAREILDNPDLMERLSRSRDGNDRGIARSDVDLVMEESRTGAADGSDHPGRLSGSLGPTRAPVGGDDLTALQTLLSAFDGLDQPTEVLFPPDKVLSREELEKVAANPDTAPALKRAARYVLDHPALFDGLARSQGMGTKGISRSDLQIGIEDARRSGRVSVPSVKPRKTPAPATTPSGSSTSSSTTKKSSSSGSSRSRDPSIKDILNDKSLSLEEKIEMILMVLENRTDDQMLSVTQQLDSNDDKKSAKDDRKKVAKLDKVDRDLNFKMEKLMKRKEQLSNLLSTMEMKFASMAQTAIANMGR